MRCSTARAGASPAFDLPNDLLDRLLSFLGLLQHLLIRLSPNLKFGSGTRIIALMGQTPVNEHVSFDVTIDIWIQDCPDLIECLLRLLQ